MAEQFGAVLDLWKWHWANKGSCISVLKTVPQCRSTQQWLSLWLSHKLANKTNLIKSIPLSLSPSPPTSLSPPHPPPHPLDIPPHKHALKVPITFVRNNNKLFFPRDSCVNEVSKCLEGNFKIIRNCTTTSPTKCKGCAKGHYFDPGYGEHGGCIRCSQPCGIFQKETRKCETAHDRLCTARNLIDIFGKSKPIKPRALKMPGHLRPYVLLFFISYINLFVYLFPIEVKCENLLLSFGSTYLFRIIHKSFSIYYTVNVRVRGTLLVSLLVSWFIKNPIGSFRWSQEHYT